MQSVCKLPITIKTRIGYDDVEDYENLYNFIEILKKTNIIWEYKILLITKIKIKLFKSDSYVEVRRQR